ncbi:peptidylprolyl isomerase [Novosphingobium sp.]|uniref:peptidylprolyl isomerase n=1 Tax=Novosphingobium sp. TaxID=1874826 RepID=UPI0025E8DFE1|nr:peptidylprolyl isomerase [Novosphingobium sp.]
MKKLIPLASLALLMQSTVAPPVLAQASAAIAAGRAAPSPLAPSEIVAAAPAGDWTPIAAADLLVMTLAPDAKGAARRVVIQLMPPPLSQGWVGNIRKLAAAHWWDGLSVNRVQDNYVAQWGDANAEEKAKARALPSGLAVVPESEYYGFSPMEVFYTIRTLKTPSAVRTKDAYAPVSSFVRGWPVGINDGGYRFRGKVPRRVVADPPPAPAIWPVHCYGMVGVGRDLSPNTGSGAELYTVIGHAPRHLDRNIALVGRVIEGIEHLSSLPRGTEALGFYNTAAERTPIVSIRLGVEVADLPRYEYLSTESGSFAKYADARANRRDAFFIRPAGGADICNIPVPVRRVK